MSIEWRVKRLENELQDLRSLPEDKKYRCEHCGQVFEKDRGSETMCSDCEEKLKKQRAQEEANTKLIGATVVSVEVDDEDSSELDSLVLMKDSNRFKLKVGGWDEHYIDVEEAE